ncbi:MAG: septation protein SpoVG family protein [Candidatus Omnitrophica bacterium]|nr:septation protein SpoVG family protein [Candidatus Omnitrophota bacterium]
MEITEVKVSLREGGNKKLKSYATVTFDDCFVVRNIKVIEGNSGLFVAMPARKMKQFCPRCGKKIDLKSRYCSQCGVQLPPPPKDLDQTRASQIHQDIAHPINQQFRDYLQKKVLDAYNDERSRVSAEKPSSESLDIQGDSEPAQEEI